MKRAEEMPATSADDPRYIAKFAWHTPHWMPPPPTPLGWPGPELLTITAQRFAPGASAQRFRFSERRGDILINSESYFSFMLRVCARSDYCADEFNSSLSENNLRSIFTSFFSLRLLRFAVVSHSQTGDRSSVVDFLLQAPGELQERTTEANKLAACWTIAYADRWQPFA